MSNFKTIPMKKLLITLAFLPLAASAQDEVPEKQYTPPKHEIIAAAGMSSILHYASVYGEPLQLSSVYFTLGYVKNLDRMQIGARLEGGSEFIEYRYFSPLLLCNRLFPLKRSYLYAGAAMGYYYFNYESRFDRTLDNLNKHGYSFGAQGGGVFYISKHLSFTTEVAVRSVQTWHKEAYYMPPAFSTFGPVNGYYMYDIKREFSLSLPVTMGIRYRFLNL